MKGLEYLHATLLAMLILPLMYAVAEMTDADGEGMFYLKCLLVAVPIIATELAVRRLKNLGVYLLSCLAVTIMVWGMTRLFFGGSGVLYPVVIVSQSVLIALMRFRERLRLARQEKEGDLYAAPALSVLNQPSLGFLWYFAVLYAIGIIFNAKTLCDFSFWNGAIYFFVALAYVYAASTKKYLGLNKRTKSIPRKRLYAISAAMTGTFAALVLLAMLPSFLLAGQRRYTDIRTWLDNIEVNDDWAGCYPELDSEGMEGNAGAAYFELGDLPPEPSKFWTYLGWAFAVACLAGLTFAALKMLRQVFGDFRDSFDENGDKVEELDSELAQQEERLHLRRSKKADSETERIRRTYRRMIRKHRKELPAPYETPTELEKNAGLSEDGEMKLLHVKYERVRYGHAQIGDAHIGQKRR